MVQARLQRVERIVRVQQQLHRAEEWKLAEIQAHIDTIERDQQDLIGLLNSDIGLRSLFADTAVKRLRSLAEQSVQAQTQRQIQLHKVIEAGSRLKAAERLLERARRAARRAEEEAQLREATERLSWQAPGKIAGR